MSHNAAAALAAAVIASAAAGQPTYTVTDTLPFPAGYTNAFLVDLADDGRVLVSANIGSVTRGFIWQNGAYTPLGAYLGLDRNDAQAMNNAGEVVGTAWTSAGWPHPWRWHNGVFTALTSFGGVNGGAFDINESGQITGYSYAPSPANFFAFVYANSTLQCLGEEPGDVASTGWRINESGQAAVTSGDPIYNDNRAAFASLAIGLHDMGTLGGIGASVNDINNLGHICGLSHTGALDANGFWDRTMFIWRDNVMTPIADLPGHPFGALIDMNDSDVCVGNAFLTTTGGSPKAIICVNDQVTDLNTLIPAGTGVSLLQGKSIRNDGRIGADGTLNGEPRFFILAPNP